MNWEIARIQPKNIIGLSMHTTNAGDAKAMIALRKEFANFKSSVKDKMNSNFLFIRQFDPGYSFDDENSAYEKWAAVEVLDFSKALKGLKTKTLAGGRYINFTHVGPASTFQNTMEMFFEEVLPKAKVEIDFSREMMEEFKNDYRSEYIYAKEQIWIPVKDLS